MLSENARGAIFMMAAMASFVVNDTLMKLVFAELPLFQSIFLRGILSTLALVLIAWWMGVLHIPKLNGDRWMVALRVVAECGSTFFFLTALFHMPLATLTAILQSAPLTIALAGALFLREPVGWRRFVAIGIGFLGVILIVRPGPEGMDAYVAYALCAVACVTLRDLVTRRMPRAVPSMLIAVTTAAGVTVFATLGALAEDWVKPTMTTWIYLGGAVVFILAGYLLSILAMRVGELGFVSPFRYTGLVWALVLGLLVFGDWPDALTGIGAALIVGTGIFTFYRERRMARKLARFDPGRAVDNPPDSPYTARTRG
ncbi:DMT family transporter [Pararhodobacter sp. SW119]|uniref:DMT family transporter n=1 Tax=Pararhodobacter sp. SW119 TaxID=2780075 RepID=UPI001ADEE250|nr:DMT family transporter [Pararhodobacter sp. SW119]